MTSWTLAPSTSEIPVARLPRRGVCLHFLSWRNWMCEDAGDRQTGWLNACKCGETTVVVL